MYEKIPNSCFVDYAIVADLDYLEQVGDETVRSLFRFDPLRIKKDVVDNPGSLDGKRLVDQIEQALKVGSWDHARTTWEYIKSRRKIMKKDLSQEERIKIEKFLERKRRDNIFILSRGAIEDYLPDQYRAKSIDQLISFVECAEFWNTLPSDGRDELHEIAKALLNFSHGTPSRAIAGR